MTPRSERTSERFARENDLVGRLRIDADDAGRPVAPPKIESIMQWKRPKERSLWIPPDPWKTQMTRFPPVLGRRTTRAVHRPHRLGCWPLSSRRLDTKGGPQAS